MSKTRGRTHAPPDTGGCQIPTSMPPIAAAPGSELSSWYCHRAPALGLPPSRGARRATRRRQGDHRENGGHGVRLLALSLAQDQPDDVAVALRRLLQAVELDLEERLLVRHAERRGAGPLDALVGLKLDRKHLALARADDADEGRLSLHCERGLLVLDGLLDRLSDDRVVGQSDRHRLHLRQDR